MTDEEIDKLEAGEKLDALISEKVMGIKWPTVPWNGDPDTHFFDRDAYSTDIRAAMKVFVKVSESTPMSLDTVFFGQRGCFASVSVPSSMASSMRRRIVTKADTFPLAICKAALKAVTRKTTND